MTEANTPGAALHGVFDAGAPLGRVWALFRASGEALALRAWGDVPDPDTARSIARELGVEEPTEAAVPETIADPLRRFARGEPIDLAAVPVEIRGSAFAVAIYRALRRVPRGRVRTYAGLASDAGRPRAMRAVGRAMAENPLPLVVPCHRVVAHENALGGYTGGVERKKILLTLEGVAVEGDRVVPGQLTLL